LVAEWGDSVDVEISQERCRALELKKDKEVFVIAKEKKIFIGNEFILNSGSE
jgi:hypothetical protein